jgi:hypothetical protein
MYYYGETKPRSSPSSTRYSLKGLGKRGLGKKRIILNFGRDDRGKRGRGVRKIA